MRLCLFSVLRTRRNGRIRKRDSFSDFSQGACVEQRQNLKEEREPSSLLHHHILAQFYLFLFAYLNAMWKNCVEMLSGASPDRGDFQSDPVTASLLSPPNSSTILNSQIITLILISIFPSPNPDWTPAANKAYWGRQFTYLPPQILHFTYTVMVNGWYLNVRWLFTPKLRGVDLMTGFLKGRETFGSLWSWRWCM